MYISEETAGGFVRNPRQEKFLRRRGVNRQPKLEKTRVDQAAARKRWSAEPPLVTVRQAVADSNLSEEVAGELVASLANLEEAKLVELISSGKLGEIISELEQAAVS